MGWLDSSTMLFFMKRFGTEQATCAAESPDGRYVASEQDYMAPFFFFFKN